MFGHVKRYYRSRDGRHYFNFKFKDAGGPIKIYCTKHPSLRGRDSDAHKTHLFSSGEVCLASGSEPRSQRGAERLAARWAEYFLEYRRTGVPQS